MKNVIAALALVIIGATAVQAQQKWSVDASHSNVLFTVDHLVISEVQGYFKLFNGSLTATKPDLSDAQVDFSVDVSSINTDNNDRDNHLKSDDFFNAAKFPAMTFKSTSMKPAGKGKYKLTGVLTIRDVKKTVTFDVSYKGEVKDPWGNTKAGFIAETSINRFDYNLKWDTKMEAGGLVVGKDVRIKLNIEMKKG
ncbi:MAG: YceI family protein [Candidatus Kapabacteria bacterium]|nr:YceI family protein [Candidatus Kapabacteria bacterium]